MFRMRRYRAFLLVAALSAVTLYYVVNVSHTRLSDVDRFRYFQFGHTDISKGTTDKYVQPPSPEHKAESPPQLSNPPPPDPELKPLPAPSTTLNRVAQSKIADFVEPTPSKAETIVGEEVTGEDLLFTQPEQEVELKELHDSHLIPIRVPGQGPQSTWQQQKEHNPVPEDEVIKLPEGKSLTLPKVQYDFPTETSAEKSDRLRKLVAIREAFKHAWQGYEKYAMPHDELLPVSKSYGDSFMGWGATMIDSLDSLWIMDFKDEFERAVNATVAVNFKTSFRKDIPMFETVIRILGGLISAYDVSNGQYPELIDKAVELADILMGAFDTPNRMPDMYYRWAPSYASQQHRSGTRIVAAEIGSLSMEFTRLAQITNNNRYYDAIARVQNAMEEWQMKTEMPGLWPLTIDASGCKKVDQVKEQADASENNGKPVLLDTGRISEEDLLEGMNPAGLPSGSKGPNVHKKRQADDISPPATGNAALDLPTPTNISADQEFCQTQGLNYEPYAKHHVYGIAAEADSTYEYMPKMHRLLGGLDSQYQNMYKNAAKMIRDKILYRPMIQDSSRNILFPATYEIDTSKRAVGRRVKVIWEATHLGCFAGGMFGLAAKTFGIPSDLDVAKQLTDGCIWAYESSTTGIMPEKFNLMPCENYETCPWNEEKWRKALDPNLKARLDAVDAWNKDQKQIYRQTGLNVAKNAQQREKPADAVQPQEREKPAEASKPQATVIPGGIAYEFSRGPANKIRKRDPPVKENPVGDAGSTGGEEEESLLGQFGFIPKTAISHDRYVKARIQEERLPPGYTKIHTRSYILRPEAIESVFIMWRITGEDYWREKGWNMFQAIQDTTHTEAGNAELEDVTSILGEKIDKMESFWLAETLKYFYLLFSEPNVVSLDDYVLNTEAHPFKVPK